MEAVTKIPASAYRGLCFLGVVQMLLDIGCFAKQAKERDLSFGGKVRFDNRVLRMANIIPYLQCTCTSAHENESGADTEL